MKSYLARALLILVMLAGTIFGLLIYNQILFLGSKILGHTYSWILIGFLFTISLVLFKVGVKTLAVDLLATKSFNEIWIPKIVKFFLSGFIGCYVAFTIMGTLLFGVDLLLGKFF